MYAPFFRLQREPFSIAPDPRFLFMSEAHREALAHLLYGLSGGGGFVLLTGEIGAGKTTVCRCFLDQVPAHCDVAYIFNPKLSALELLQTVCDEFHIHRPEGPATIKDLVDALNLFLLRSHAAGRHAVLIIDEAQSLSAEVLEQLRLLTNLETAERKLLQIVLIGQPELRTMLARPDLEQLAQRVIARYHLPALSETETVQYVRHRLAVAGLQGEIPFDERALHRIHQLCGGVPRRINLLADRALLGAYAGSKARIDKEIVDRAAREVFGGPDEVPRRRTAAFAALAFLLLLGGGDFLWRQNAARTKDASPRAVATTAMPAPAASVAASAPPPTTDIPLLADAGTLFARAQRSEAAAWRALAPRWKLELPEGSDPCDAAARRKVYCLRVNGGLALVRELGRPGLLTLHADKEHASFVLLTGLSGDQALLDLGGTPVKLPLTVLAGLWRGEFATLWQAPPPYREPLGAADAAPLTEWVARHLPASASGDSLKARLVAFQVAHGLKPDGLAGPMTLMQINRASGLDEPRLNPER